MNVHAAFNEPLTCKYLVPDVMLTMVLGYRLSVSATARNSSEALQIGPPHNGAQL